MDKSFSISIADLVFRIHPVYDLARLECSAYIVPDSTAPVAEIKMSMEDIIEERRIVVSANHADPDDMNVFPYILVESSAIYRKIAEILPQFNAVVFHGSALSVNGEGYLFSAPSGTGKSTHVNLWKQKFGDSAVIVNDDKPILKKTENGVLVCGTPWAGKSALSRNISVPLKALYFLKRSPKNFVIPQNGNDVFTALLEQMFIPSESEAMDSSIEVLESVISSTKIYYLYCNMDPEAADVAYSASNK